MHAPYIHLIFFLYGLSFFSMGVAITLELERCSDARLRYGLRFLALFGFLHGTHEWLEMFMGLGSLPSQEEFSMLYDSMRLALLALSFLPLAAFGASLLSPHERYLRLSLFAPLGLIGVWAFGLLIVKERYSLSVGLWDVADVWTRYVLAIPSALLASTGLVIQQRTYRQAGLAQFGQDSLWAAIAFAWYGLVGQIFTRASPLPPSTFLNTELFLRLFGFPVQLLRALAALVAATFVIRSLRSFEVVTKRKIAELQAARLEEAQRREALRGDLLRRVVAAQETERQRIARELHDETGQALTAIGLGLRGISTMLNQDGEKAAQNLRHLENLAAQSLEELQRLIADLRPTHLDDLGLPATLRWYANEIQGRARLKVNVEILGEQRQISPEINTALFRIAQEALTNVVKHSGASQVCVRLFYREDAVTLQVEDDGSGFDMSIMGSLKRRSWGLLGMEERASLLGGKLNLESHPGQGTWVEVTIPNRQDLEEFDDDTPGAGR